MSDLMSRRAVFRRLHERGCFLIPNPWDVGTARYLRHLGFQALATTSSGFSFSRGPPAGDSAVPRAAIDGAGGGVLLTARAECFLVGHSDALRESIRRLQAYAEAGADVLYAPGPHTREDIAALVAAVAPRPLNVLMSASTGLRLSDL